MPTSTAYRTNSGRIAAVDAEKSTRSVTSRRHHFSYAAQDFAERIMLYVELLLFRAFHCPLQSNRLSTGCPPDVARQYSR
jgi:hypothetical protein